MKLLDTFLPAGKYTTLYTLLFANSLLLGLSTPSFSQCDINIFQRGTLNNGTISLMPWLSYTSGCSLVDDCGTSKELIIWDMEDLDPCEEVIPKSYIDNAVVAVGCSAKSTKTSYTAGNNSKHALAIAKGQSARFNVQFSPDEGQSGYISFLAMDIKSVTDPSELYCDKPLKLSSTSLVANYSITILSRGRQIYMGLKSADADWNEEVIDLDFISDTENIFNETEPLNLEVIIANFTTTGHAALALDNLVFEGKECSFEDNLEYAWSTGETTERIYSAKKGNYCVTITDCNGCQAIDCISVN